MTSAGCLDLQRSESVVMLDRIVADHRAWTRESVGARDWTVAMPPAARAEIATLVDRLRREPLPILMLRPEDFELSASRAMMARVKSILDDGIGVALVDRLPVETMSQEEATAAYWVLGQFIAMPVAQKWDGTMIYDVRDTGRAFEYGVRASWTSVELDFHTDNPFAVAPPDYVGLLCLQPAREGGVSRFASLYTVHNEMLRRHPRLLARLYRPFYYDRQAEHAPGGPRVSWAPAFRWDGARLRARLSVTLVRKGYALMGAELDAEGAEALDALGEVMADPSLWIEFTIQRGQLQYLNNWEFCHFRSEFKDHADLALKRHLIRLWFREQGRRSYDG